MQPELRGLWLAWLAERVGDWLVLLALLAVAAQSSVENSSAVAWTLALWVGPRIVLAVLYSDAGPRLGRYGWPALSLAKAVATVVLVAGATAGLIRGLEVLLGLTAIVGFVSAVSMEARYTTLQNAAGLRQLGQATGAASLIDRASLLIGGALATVIALLLPEGTISPIPAIALFIVAAAASFTVVRAVASPSRPVAQESPPVPADLARRVVVWLAAAFTAGAVGAALLVSAFALFSNRCLTYGPCDVITVDSAGPLLVAAAGLGMLLGPLPMPRLLVRLSAELVLLLLAVVVLFSTVAAVMLRPPGLGFVSVVQSASMALAFFVFGFAASNLDRLRLIAIQRLVPPEHLSRVRRTSFLALTAGQLFGVIGIVSTGGRDPLAITILLGVAQLVLLVLGTARVGSDGLRVGSLSSLPVKSVVHKLSWETRPASAPADFNSSEPRVRHLATWINRRAAPERLTVTLPRSRREYTIYRPTDQARESLFEQGRADPEKQMPYWAKVWPSGVALADVVVERKEEVAGRHVLELGAGLGVTACTVLEYGGRIVTADYSALPLAYCRLNTLANTGKAPRATCFNWRHDPEVTAALRKPEFLGGFPLIIAGDVLYEGRDAEPLLNVIERMLVDDGSLWLAEPVRRTAQRFLDSAAELGWDSSSKQVTAEWPDATDGPVNLHFLNRSRQAETITTDLGGWRI